MEQKEFDFAVGEIFDAIPEKFRLALGETAVVVDDEDENEPDLLGCFDGISNVERSINDVAPMPNRIVIYRLPILKEAVESDGDVRRVIRETMIHEIAHALGYDEEEIEEKFESRWE